MSEVSFIKKITVKNVAGKVTPPKDAKPASVMRVIGVATHYDVREGTYGPSVRFKGRFEATDMTTKNGATVRSATLYLPEVATDMLLAAFPDGEMCAIQFGFDIMVKKNEQSAIGYEYEAKPLIRDESTDPLANVRLAIEQGGKNE